MKINKFIIVTFLLIILTVVVLSACDKASEELIELPYYDKIYLGTFEVTKIKKSGSDCLLYYVEKGAQDNLLNIFRDSKYFVGEFELYNSPHFEDTDSHLRIGENAIWLAYQGVIWVCQTYGDKCVIVQKMRYDLIRNEKSDFCVYVSKALFMPGTQQYIYDTEYKTPFSWDIFKKFYSTARVNEENKSIKVDCLYYTTSNDSGDSNYRKGTTTLYFNEINNTIWMSSNFTPNKA